MENRKIILVNKAQCRLCGDIIESKSRYDFKFCKCKNIFVDGGHNYLRRGSETGVDDIIELSEFGEI